MSLPVKVLTALLLVSLVELFFSDAHSEEGRWKEIGNSKTDTRWYIDTESLSCPSKDSILVWVRSIPDKANPEYGEGEESTWSIMKEIQARYFGIYACTEGLSELDCSKGMVRVLYFVAYDKKGEIITSSLDPDAEWAFIMPGSVGETLRETLCK